VGAFEVQPFSSETLERLLVENSHGANEGVRDKAHVRYLHGYLHQLACRTIVLERNYTDRSFLEDYAAYYVRCFEPYARTCTRMHFFDEDFDEEALTDAITADDPRRLQKHYLGFIVVKPLPLTVIGKTCLRAYPDADTHKRHYPTIRCQSANMFGLKLFVDTLPFQEQDREVAACASSALWSVLHSTAHLFQHAILSPVEITRTASAQARLDGRTFPNGDGLNTLQMADAIRSVGLEPLGIGVSSVETVSVRSPEFATMEKVADDDGEKKEAREERARRMQLELKIAALAYLRSGISCLLLCRMKDEVGDKHVVRGNHAVALTGYGLKPNGSITPYTEAGTRFMASRVNRLYVHDDQVGPFARFTFEPGNLLYAGNLVAPENHRRLADPINLVVPLYHKVRIPLSQAIDITVSLDQALKALKDMIPWSEDLEWDIQLNTIEKIRDEVARSQLGREDKFALLTLPLPRFMWRLSASVSGNPVFDILLDATDLLQGSLVRRIIAHDAKISREAAFTLSPLREHLPRKLLPLIDKFDEFASASD
jgi:hypothetical protein